VSAAESTGFTPPAAFGPYRVLHQIGSGVLGPVFRTYDPQNDRLVAVKAFRLEIVPEDVARLAESLRRLPSSGLSHPGIVNAIDAGLEGMSAFLAMEYVSAETLDVALRHLAPSPLDRALPLIADIAEAIEAAWAAGYGHGSLHPRDVFVASGTNEVRVTGFGVGQALEAAGIKVPPRRPYTAPERSAGGSWDIRADVYSLGAIAHELLTKRRPGGAGEQDGSLVTGTTPEQRRLIRGVLSAALADSPEHRFHSARAFANALGAIVRGEPVGPLPEGPAAVTEPKDEPRAEPLAEPPGVTPRELIHEPAAESKREHAAGEPKKPARPRSQVPVAKPTPLFASIDAPPVEPAPSPAVVPEPPDVHVQPPPHVPTDFPAETRDVVQDHVSAPADIAARVVPAEPVVHVEPTLRVSHAEPAAHAAHHVEIQHVAPISPHVTSMFTHEAESAAPAPISFAAIAAAVVAASVLFGVGGYWAGLHRIGLPAIPAAAGPSAPSSAAGSPATQTPPAIPPGTDVSVPAGSASVAAGGALVLPDVKAPGKSNEAPTRTPPPPPPPPPPVPATGRLIVRSTPADATVKIDGRARGATPITVRDLALGAHTIEVSHAGFATRTEHVTLTAAAASKTLALDLQPQPAAPAQAQPPAPAGRSGAGVGSISLESRPAGARIFLDGKDAGKTPTTLPDVKAGAHRLRFELTGYKALDTTVTVRAGQQERVTVTLEQALLSFLRSPNHQITR
jgi:serine/threonine protein kinase